MLQIITTPLILVVSTAVPLVVTVETLQMRGGLENSTSTRNLTRQLLKFWCLHALCRSVPNPVLYMVRALPLMNFVELVVWTLLARELLRQLYSCTVPTGSTVAASAPRNGSWFGYLYYDAHQSSGRYVFGHVSVWLLQTVEKWPLDVRLLDKLYQAFMGAVGRVGISSAASKANGGKNEPKSWGWSAEWFRQTASSEGLEEEYDMLEDVLGDMRGARSEARSG
ncbi:LAFE_0F15654g1_1 [Lachancea fermentati]|uniref:LAFE_0F15654g1_1 n=1 Tax=Lachancea fermentati TaxID=4955 RepID=A0A1G4MG84_LACFM|nr:LAFE_0F15654g1_1 [Lachancea fermentati]